jgi:hypothetical protein
MRAIGFLLSAMLIGCLAPRVTSAQASPEEMNLILEGLTSHDEERCWEALNELSRVSSYSIAPKTCSIIATELCRIVDKGTDKCADKAAVLLRSDKYNVFVKDLLPGILWRRISEMDRRAQSQEDAFSLLTTLINHGDDKAVQRFLQEAERREGWRMQGTKYLMTLDPERIPRPEAVAMTRKAIDKLNDYLKAQEFRVIVGDSVGHVTPVDPVKRLRLHELIPEVRELHRTADNLNRWIEDGTVKLKEWGEEGPFQGAYGLSPHHELALTPVVLDIHAIKLATADVLAGFGMAVYLDVVGSYLNFAWFHRPSATPNRPDPPPIAEHGSTIRGEAATRLGMLVGRTFKNHVHASDWWRANKTLLRYDAATGRYVVINPPRSSPKEQR